MPHMLRSCRLTDEQFAEFTMLRSLDDERSAQATQSSNCIRGLLTQTHPAPEHIPGPRRDHPR